MMQKGDTLIITHTHDAAQPGEPPLLLRQGETGVIDEVWEYSGYVIYSCRMATGVSVWVHDDSAELYRPAPVTPSPLVVWVKRLRAWLRSTRSGVLRSR